MPPKEEINLSSVNPPSARLMSFTKPAHKIIIDSGASTCSNGHRSQLQNIRPTSVTVSAAFGETVQPTEMGDLPLCDHNMLPTVVINEMDNTTLLSVSQACKEGMCGIFTAVDCFKSIMPFLSMISENGQETMRGAVEEGLYVQEST